MNYAGIRFIDLIQLDIVLEYVILVDNVIMNEHVKEHRFINARINENGRIVIPAAVREQMGLKAGEALVMEIEDGVLRIESHRAHIRRIQQEFRQPAASSPKLPPQKLFNEQLIEDRQQDTIQEMEPWLG